MTKTSKIRILGMLVGVIVLAAAAITPTIRRPHGSARVAAISSPSGTRPAAPPSAHVTTTAAPRPPSTGTAPPTSVGTDLSGRLRSLGYWVGNGSKPLVQQAITAFQKVEGLKPDGIDGPAVQVALVGAHRPTATAKGDLIEIDKSRQVLFVVRNGTVQWTLNISTGSGKPYRQQGRTYVATTPPGQFSVERAVNGNDKGPLGVLYRPRYFNGGIAVHGYGSVPSYPASHGCVRVSIAAMDWIWANKIMPIGSPVRVY